MEKEKAAAGKTNRRQETRGGWDRRSKEDVWGEREGKGREGRL